LTNKQEGNEMTEEDKKAWSQFLERGSLTVIGKIILATGAARWYRNGTFFSPSLKWWHPITWLYVTIFLIIVAPVCLFTKISVKEAIAKLWEDLTVVKYFKENPDKLRWVKK